MAWSSTARLSALNPHAPFAHALTPDQPKQRNPLLPPPDHAVPHAAGGGAAAAAAEVPPHVHLARTTDFAATIPLAELIHADEMAQTKAMQRRRRRTEQQQQHQFAVTMTPTPNLLGTSAHLARTQALFATSSTPSSSLPVRVPPANSYSMALAQVHAARADRLQRLPAGWSQAAAIDKQQRRMEESQGVAVYNGALYGEIAAEARDAQAEIAQQRRRARTAPHRSNLSATAPIDALTAEEAALSAALSPRRRGAERAALATAKLQHFWQTVRDEEARLSQRLRERMEAKHARDDAQFAAMLSRLGENKDLLADMDQYLALGEEEGERRKERLYQQWCAQVYEPIQSAVSAGLAARSTASIEARRRGLFDDFLRISNSKKRGLYGDVVIESDYDALAARGHVLRVSTGKLRDPLKAAREAADDEWALHHVFHPESRRIEHRVKDSLLPAPVWAKGKIEATPHGRYSLLRGNVAAPVGKRLVEPQLVRSGQHRHTAAESLDHYDVDTDPRTAAAQFFPHGGKRVQGYDRDNDPHGYDILASTEPSVRRRFQMRAEQERRDVQALPNIGAQGAPSHAQSPSDRQGLSTGHFVPARSTAFVESKSQD